MRFAQNAMAKNMQARCANTMFALLPQKCGKDAAQQRATDDKAVRRSLCGVALNILPQFTKLFKRVLYFFEKCGTINGKFNFDFQNQY